MPYQYYGGQRGGYAPQYPQQGLQGLQYQQPQQQQESPFSQIDPNNIKSAYDMYNAGSAVGPAQTGGTQFASAGSSGTGGGMAGGPSMAGGSMGSAFGGGAQFASAGSAGTGGGMAGGPTMAGGSMGGGAAGGSSGAGSAVASAGPWAALAAIIMVNEYNAKGHRSKNKTQYGKDLVSGEVFHQDMEQRWLPKLGMKEGSKANAWGSHLANPVNPLSPGKSWKRFKKLF